MNSISVGLIATLLMLYGVSINNYFKRITRSIPFWGRFALFVVLCSVGYAFASSQLVRLLKMAFASSQLVRLLKMALCQLSDLPLIGVVAGCFLLLAFLAKSGKDI